MGMRKTILRFVKESNVCQTHKYQVLALVGFLQPLLVPQLIWQEVSMDFIIGIPKSQWFKVIMVIVDWLSKYAHFILLKHPFTTKIVAKFFVREVVGLHGFPKAIFIDKEPVFLSNFWEEMLKLQRTKLKMSSSYFPQSNSQIEIVNHCLETYLRYFTFKQHKICQFVLLG